MPASLDLSFFMHAASAHCESIASTLPQILDLGCGPGLWTHLLAEKVKSNGRVVRLDFSPDLINYAVENLKKDSLSKIIELRKGDFHDVPFDNDTFDLVFFSNCFAYVTDHFKIMEEMKRVTKKGGRIAAKDFDGALFIVHPIEPQLSLKILAAAVQALKEDPLEPLFDNFVGRKLHGLFLQAGLKDVSTKSYAIQKLSPLIPEAKRIAGFAETVEIAWARDYMSVFFEKMGEGMTSLQVNDYVWNTYRYDWQSRHPGYTAVPLVEYGQTFWL